MSSGQEYYFMGKKEENRYLLENDDKCDKYDYLTAVACGAIGGVIDIFLVGIPGASELGTWTDKQVDTAVKKFAKMRGWQPKEAQKDNVASAIGFLERKYKVNYDQRYSSDVDGLFNMSTRNHHIMSLSHSTDIVGLFFSILNQFTSTSSFVANGSIVTIKTETFELEGHSFISKLFCGIANWFGHIMSDIAGSSGSRGNLERGTGVPVPFFELFQFCNFGSFQVGDARQDFATIAVRAFQEGYDFRFGLVTAIPVMITDLSIRLIWSIRQHFQYKRPLKECIPSSKHANLRVMLLFGEGTLCVMDGLDAGVKSEGSVLVFFMHLNLIAWYRFVTLVIKEVCIRTGITDALEKELAAYRRINESVKAYLQQIEKVDVELFQRETEEWSVMADSLASVSSEESLNQVLNDAYEKYGISKPWRGDFDTHMSNKKGKLVFE